MPAAAKPEVWPAALMAEMAFGIAGATAREASSGHVTANPSSEGATGYCLSQNATRKPRLRCISFTYESASCQVGGSTAEKPQNLASQPLFEYTTTELAGDRAMLASNPSTEPVAGMREGRTPDLPSPAWPNPSRHQAPNAGVRGRAPSAFASGSPSFADDLRPSALRTAVFSPISHRFAKTSAGAFFRHGFRIHKNGLFKARTTIALTRYGTPLWEEVTRADVGSR